MKLFKYIVPVALLAMLGACSELDKVTATDEPVAPVLKPHAAIVITADNMVSTTPFKWDRADFGYPDAAEYTLYAQVGDNEEVIVGSAFGDSISVKLEDLNRVVLEAGATIGVATDVMFSLSAFISEAYDHVVVSAPLKVNVKTFKPDPAYLWIAGSFKFPASWSPSDPKAPKLTANLPTDPFEGMVDLTTDGGGALAFKFCAKPNWDGPNYGGTTEALDPSGGDITDLPNGYYRLVVNPAKTSVTAKLAINTIGIIGDGVPGDWGSETKMTYTQATNSWAVTVPMTNGKKFKLRCNDDWSHAIGGPLNEATFTGGDITVNVPSGNYKVTLYADRFPYQITITAP